MAADVALLRLPLVKRIVILVATLCARLANVTTPPTAVALVVPCRVPLPALRAALTTVLLSLVRKLPYWSCTTGCWANGAPAVALAEGWVWMTSLLAAAGATLTLAEVIDARPKLEKL